MTLRKKLAGRKSGPVRRMLRAVRAKVPAKAKLGVWRSTAKAVLKRRRWKEGESLFRAIEIETRTLCNSACSFCGASVLHDQRDDLLMPQALFRKICDELASHSFDGTIRLFVNNEPLLDRRLPELIRMAKETCGKATIEVQTNGIKLNPDKGRKILEAGLDRLIVNNYSDDGNVHHGVAKFFAEVAPLFPDREITLVMRKLNEKLQNRAGTAPDSEALRNPLTLPCILPFDEIVLTANGNVSICCQDLEFSHSVGNVNDTSLEEIWFGGEFAALRLELAKGNRGWHPLCSGCDFRGYKEEHMTGRESVGNRVVGGYWE